MNDNQMEQITIPFEKNQENRQTNRRSQLLKAFFLSFYKGRRDQARRYHEASKPFYVDLYEPWIGLNIIIIVCLSALDSFLTLQIIGRGGIEVNPLMISLLEINTSAFVFGKMAITTICLLFLLVHIKFKILRLFSMPGFLISLTGFYVLLIAYELALLATI